jgi:hypothetical protein
MAQNFAAPIWMTFKQAMELDAHIRKGEKGSLVVYADSVTRKETDEKTGDEIDREIPFLKGYTVFNVEKIEGLPEVYYAKAAPTLDCGPHRARGTVLRSLGSNHSTWRKPCILQHRRRCNPDAAIRELPRCGQLLCNPCS